MDNEFHKDRLSKVRIFVTTASAGAPGIFAYTRILRQHDIQIDFWNLTVNKFGFPFDKTMPRTRIILINGLIRLIFFMFCLFKYNIFHFYSMMFFFHRKTELYILRLFNKKIINTFVGSEAFDIEQSIKEDGKNSAYYSFAQNQSPSFFRIHNKNKKNAIAYSHKIVLNGPWLIHSVDVFDAIIPYSREIPSLIVHNENTDKKSSHTVIGSLTILHAPTNRSIKGTHHIIREVEKLRKKGLNIKLDLPEKIKYHDLQKRILKADIIIDQILIGWYGGFAVEAMALEKPVIAYIKDEYLRAVPFGKEIPIINAGINNLSETIEYYYHNKQMLYSLGHKGRLFVEKIHAPGTIAAQYASLYASLVR